MIKLFCDTINWKVTWCLAFKYAHLQCDGSGIYYLTVEQGVRLANLFRELIIGIETVCDRRKPKYAINRTILDKNFHKQLILRYIGKGRP